jgi:hypothetical protein
MPRQKPPRKSYTPVLTWAELSPPEPDKGWRFLTLTTTLDEKRYIINIRTRHKWWGCKQRTCDIDLYQDLGENEDYYEPVEFGPCYLNIRIFDPQRYKHEAIAWAENVILTPMMRLKIGMTP